MQRCQHKELEIGMVLKSKRGFEGVLPQSNESFRDIANNRNNKEISAQQIAPLA